MFDAKISMVGVWDTVGSLGIPAILGGLVCGSPRRCRRRLSETGLSDITLGWMMGNARRLGLDFVDSVWPQYAAIDPKHTLDTIHEPVAR